MGYTYRAKGGAVELFTAMEPEVMIEGPAGTGKSRAVLQKLVYLCEKYPACRALICRQTRTSLTNTVLVTMEHHVLPATHPALADSVSPSFRKAYRFPNRSQIDLVGLDKPSRIMSSEYDIIAVFEATETTEEAWEMLGTRLRNNRIPAPERVPHWWPKDDMGRPEPFHQLIADCNPGRKDHWLNRRANTIIHAEDDARRGQTMLRRILSRHEDNPTVTLQYLQRLRNLSGHRRSRLYDGIWVTAEGMVWPEWNADVHMLPPNEAPPFAWHFASMDFGNRAPGVLQVWAVDGDQSMTRVAEWYMTKKTEDWWADRVVEAFDRWNMKQVVCDSAEPDRIAYLNKRLGDEVVGRNRPGICVPANKTLETGLGVVRDGLYWSPRQGARIRLVRGALQHAPDPDRVEDKQPTCTEEEIGDYIYPADNETGKIRRENPDPRCEDHGCDALRYAAMWAFAKDWGEPGEKQPRFLPGSYGAEFGAAKILGEEE